jgi:tetratricopeptide (TPR) repeat protein
MDHLSRALQLLASGHLDEARIYLEELLRQDPDNPDILYNLGLCYVDLGQLDKGMELLHRCLQLAPGHSHAYVALGIAYQKKGDLPRAKEYAMRALAADPKNPVALKNLIAIFGQEGDSLKALYYLSRSNECDPQGPQAVYGLSLRLSGAGRHRAGPEAFPDVLGMEAPENLRGLARNGLREIAVRGLKAKGPRMDAVFYMLDAMRLFSGKSLEEIQEISFEIGMLGAARAGHQRPPGDACPAGVAGEDILGAGAGVHHVCGLQEDRAGDGYRGGSGRGVGDGGEAS